MRLTPGSLLMIPVLKELDTTEGRGPDGGGSKGSGPDGGGGKGRGPDGGGGKGRGPDGGGGKGRGPDEAGSKGSGPDIWKSLRTFGAIRTLRSETLWWFLAKSRPFRVIPFTQHVIRNQNLDLYSMII